MWRSYLRLETLSGVVLLLEVGDPVWCGGLVEAAHVLVHLREALLHVVLSAALAHGSKAEPLRRVVELQNPEARTGREQAESFRERERRRKREGEWK